MHAECDVLERHVWLEPFADGDTCACGRYHLDLHPYPRNGGVAAELCETPSRESFAPIEEPEED